MAAKLVWRDESLMLGPWCLARVWYATKDVVAQIDATGDFGVDNERWESKEDAMQDVEREVRRLLREAGAEVEP